MHKLVLNNITIDNLQEAAQRIIEVSDHTTLWCFHGEMGAGKTTLIQAICRALGVTGEVTSPTFSLVNEYLSATGKTIYHFDFYRIRSIEEVYDIGYEDYFYSNNICLIEWPSQIEELLAGEPVLNVTLTKTAEDSRTIVVG
ncbi:MAG: tRNA (adenosine(37)-N6)-threonylcarbamoyltransferase complex ATPase subunit type 1 TsaE [Bacteroidota bacterium]